MIVLDTNVLAETFRVAPSPAVMQWLSAQEPLSIFTTAITEAELLYGIELMPAGKRRNALNAAISSTLAEEFNGRVLSFDEQAARIYARILAGRNALGRPISELDAMIAAICKARNAALATRNTRDFEHCGIRLIDPWRD